MKRWVAMLLILVFTLSGCGLLEGIGETDPAANPVEGNTGTDADYLSLTAELEQARQVKLELGSEAQAALPDFAAAVELLRDQGLEFLSYGMPRQASWYLSFAGGSAEGVEYPDFMSQLSPEMQAQWAEMEQELTDPEMMEMFEGMEGME